MAWIHLGLRVWPKRPKAKIRVEGMNSYAMTLALFSFRILYWCFRDNNILVHDQDRKDFKMDIRKTDT